MNPSYLLYLALAIIIYRLITTIRARRRDDKERRLRGCELPPALPARDPFGLIRLIEALRAGRDERMPQYVAGLIDSIGLDVHTMRAQLLSDEMTVTRDPEIVKAIFSTQAHEFDIGPNRLESFKPLLGVGMTTARGEPWKRSRALLRPQFSREQVADLEMEKRHVDELLGYLHAGVSGNGWTGKIDLQPMFMNFTFDAATEMLYGKSVNTQQHYFRKANRQAELVHASERQDDAVEFGHHLEAGKSWLYERMVFGRFGWLFSSQKFSNHCKKVHEYVDGFVYTRLGNNGLLPAKPSSSPSQFKGTENEKEKFILLNELAKHSHDPLELRNETLHVLSAGKDTTAALLGWLFYFLARHPHIFTKLRSAILTDFPSDTSIDFHTLNNCRYLQHCINETFRVAAVIPVIERLCTRDTTLPSGGGKKGTSPIFLREGSRVLISTYGMQHRKDIWGEDAEEFRPERWEGRKVGYEFVPFAGGPRKCIGRKSALVTSHPPFSLPSMHTNYTGTY